MTLATKYAALIAKAFGLNEKRRRSLHDILEAYEVELRLEWQHRVLPDEVNAEVLGCSGRETMQ